MSASNAAGNSAPVLLVSGEAQRLESLRAEAEALGLVARLGRTDESAAGPFQPVRMEASAATARVLAHEIASYLGTLRTMSGVLEEELPQGSEASGDVGMIVEALDAADRFLAALRAFVHPLPLGEAVSDLGAVLRALEPELRRAVPAPASVAFSLPAGPLAVSGEAARLRWLASELVAAGLRLAGPSGTVTLGADAQPAQRLARLDVRSDGEPVTADRVRRLFEPFVADRTYDGGLRLPAVYAAVVAAGGTVVAVPGPGSGVTITISLPLAPDAAAVAG